MNCLPKRRWPKLASMNSTTLAGNWGFRLRTATLSISTIPATGETLTYDEAKAVIEKYIDLYPDADHYTLSYHDIHPDHAAVGQALLDLYNDGRIQYNVRFIISMATRTDYENRGAAIPDGGWKDVPTDDTIKQKAINACRCYAAWAPSLGAYAVGYHSVAGQFDKFTANSFHYLHLANQ
jgi:hypothetical protein